jgi:hypothetical protein
MAHWLPSTPDPFFDASRDHFILKPALSNRTLGLFYKKEREPVHLIPGTRTAIRMPAPRTLP